MNKKRNNKGFSLVELIVVIAVMAVLVVVLAPAYLRYVDKAKVQKDVSAVSEVVNSIKIAASELRVSEEITNAGEDGITVTVTDNAVIVTTGEIADDKDTYTDLGDEIRATVGDKLDFASAALNGHKVTIVVTQDKVDYGITIDVEGVAVGSGKTIDSEVLEDLDKLDENHVDEEE